MKLPNLKNSPIKPKSQTIALIYLHSIKIRTRNYQKTALLKVEENKKLYTHDNLLKAWLFTIMRAVFVPDFYYGRHIDARPLKKITGKEAEADQDVLYNIESLSMKPALFAKKRSKTQLNGYTSPKKE